jgi:coenzyme F420 hydrogenase subunit beta
MNCKVDTISKVVESNLCNGCGACAGAFPNAFKMIDDAIEGRRPVALSPNGSADRDAISVCGGLGLAPLPAKDKVEADWGPVLACWEGHAADAETRFRGSSGGAVTALATFLLEKDQAGAVAHIRGRRDDPRFNEATLSTTGQDILSAAGSRYAQASLLDLLPQVREAPTQVAFIGKPCDITSLTKARQFDPDLDRRVGLTIAIFCAGAPNLAATETLLDRLGVPKKAKLTDLRYRGFGWPGKMQARWIDADGTPQVSAAISYADGWGSVLQSGRRWRCRICDDHTGAFADISVGDPWHTPPQGQKDKGKSLIVARTPAGKALIEEAIAAGVLIATEAPRDVIAAAQPNLLQTNAAVWGRRVAMTLVGMPTPLASTSSSFGAWLRQLSTVNKVKSILGTIKRIWQKRLFRAVRLTPVQRDQ